MALREILLKLGIDTSELPKGAKEGRSAAEGLERTFNKLGMAMGGGIVLEGLHRMLDGLEEQAVGLKHTSQQLGIGVQDLQAWQTAAKLSGVDAETFNGSLKKLEIAAGKAGEAGSESGGEFSKLGVKLRDQAGGPMRDMQSILHDTGMAIAKLPDPAARAQAVLKTFGRSGQALLPLFQQGEKGLKQALAQIDRLGGGLTDDAIEQLEGMHIATQKWDIAMTSLKGRMVTAFLPGLTAMTEKLTGGIVALSKTKGGVAALEVGVVALGAAGAVAALAFIGPWLPAITGFTLLGLLVQDFIVGLNGGDSEIGHIIDKLFGAGSGDSFFVGVKKDVNDLIEKVKELVGWIKSVRDAAKDWNDAGTAHPGESAEDTAARMLQPLQRKQNEEQAKRDKERGFTPTNFAAQENVGGLSQDDVARIKYTLAHGMSEHLGGTDIAGIQHTSMDALKKQFSIGQIDDIARQIGGRDKIGAFAQVPTVPANAKPEVKQTNSMQVSITNQITAPSGSGQDIAGALGPVQDANLRAASDALGKRAAQ